MTPALRLLLISALASLAFFGLAILGWGGFAAFFSHPPSTVLVIRPGDGGRRTAQCRQSQPGRA